MNRKRSVHPHADSRHQVETRFTILQTDVGIVGETNYHEQLTPKSGVHTSSKIQILEEKIQNPNQSVVDKLDTGEVEIQKKLEVMSKPGL